MASIGGRDSVVYSAATDGYLEYDGLGWVAHLIVDPRLVFQDDQDDQGATGALDLPIEALVESSLIDRSCRDAFEHVQDDKLTIQRIAFNGLIFASRLGRRGLTLGPVFEEITRIGDSVTQRMEQLLGELARSEAAFCERVLARFALQAIDLIDRNLFERAADVRWWATDAFFWRALAAGAQDDFQAAAARLHVIQDSYTMYRNLVLIGADGAVVACSKEGELARINSLNLSGESWMSEVMDSRSSTQYLARDYAFSDLEPEHDGSLIFAAGVRAGGARTGAAIGVLATLFDWHTEAVNILKSCLPATADGEDIAGCLAVFTDRGGRVTHSTDFNLAKPGDQLPIPNSLAGLQRGQTGTGLVHLAQQEFLIGSARSRGYREYAGLQWMAHVLRPLHHN